MKAAILTLAILSIIAGAASAQPARQEKQSSGNSLTQVHIHNQTWASENLNTARFRNGDLIPEVKTKEEWKQAAKDKKPAWCYLKNDPANGAKFGRLYNWYAVTDSRGLAPKGWHIPSDDEWSSMVSNAGGIISGADKLKGTSDWKKDKNGSNESGFNGLPGGSIDDWGDFTEAGANGYWWTATPISGREGGYGYRIEHIGLISKETYNVAGLSVRCMKD